jgi:hypothetical protein
VSSEATAWAHSQTVGSSTTKFVLIAIADSADENHRVQINFERLSRITELSTTKIGRALLRLQDLRLLDGETLNVGARS